MLMDKRTIAFSYSPNAATISLAAYFTYDLVMFGTIIMSYFIFLKLTYHSIVKTKYTSERTKTLQKRLQLAMIMEVIFKSLIEFSSTLNLSFLALSRRCASLSCT